MIAQISRHSLGGSENEPATKSRARYSRSTHKTKPLWRKACVKYFKKALACAGAGFAPVAAYVVKRCEVEASPAMISLVWGCMLYSAPSCAQWAKTWIGRATRNNRNRLKLETFYWSKAVGFTVLLEGVMIFSSITTLSIAALAMLVLINSNYAWETSSGK